MANSRLKACVRLERTGAVKAVYGRAVRVKKIIVGTKRYTQILRPAMQQAESAASGSGIHAKSETVGVLISQTQVIASIIRLASVVLGLAVTVILILAGVQHQTRAALQNRTVIGRHLRRLAGAMKSTAGHGTQSMEAIRHFARVTRTASRANGLEIPFQAL